MLLKTAMRRVIERFGYEISKKSRTTDHSKINMDQALYRCKARGVRVASVFDIGASNGSWSEICLRHFSDASYALVEAQDIYGPSLDDFCLHHPSCRAVIAAAGREVGRSHFDNSQALGGAVLDEAGSCTISVPTTTIDVTRDSLNLRPPHLIKLDTHGYEVPILEGASRTLPEASLLVIEAYNFRISERSLKFYELCLYLEKKGFCPIDIGDVMLRSYDASFWQMDLFFVPANSHPFLHRSFN
jgi:FkbM family methyltransferase